MLRSVNIARWNGDSRASSSVSRLCRLWIALSIGKECQNDHAIAKAYFVRAAVALSAIRADGVSLEEYGQCLQWFALVYCPSVHAKRVPGDILAPYAHFGEFKAWKKRYAYVIESRGFGFAIRRCPLEGKR